MHVSAFGNRITVHGVETAGHSDRHHLKEFDGAKVEFVSRDGESELVLTAVAE